MAQHRFWFSRRQIVRVMALAAALLVTLSIILFAGWAIQLDQNIKKRFAQKRFAPPTEFYSAPEHVRVGWRFPQNYFVDHFKRMNYRSRPYGQTIQSGDYSIWDGSQCRNVVSTEDWEADLNHCLAFRNIDGARSHGHQVDAPSVNDETHSDIYILAFSQDGTVLEILSGPPFRPSTDIWLQPKLFAKYYGDNPVLREEVQIGDTPTHCLNALLAIEDSQFLEHPGISVTGLARALYTNLRSGRVAQGGSTITQQLVKNYFLSDERTLKRKLTEIVMAFFVENRISKDDILETYINLIYMGQNGPFQVRGFAAASEHYYGKPLTSLNLPQCALLAAIVNSPGLFNPFTHPHNASKRRTRVLDRMLELKMIAPEEAKEAKKSPLPHRPQRSLTEPAPYFVQAVRRVLNEKGIDERSGLRVYTTLNLRSQEAAHQAVRQGLENLEKHNPHIKNLKAKGKNLESLLLATDVKTGGIQALVGGRGYLTTQFNRAIDSRRQVGSVMKPFVYLTALETLTESGEPYGPLTPLYDQPTTHRFEGQTWTPRNYDGQYRGEIPLFFALKESLNVPTAKLAMSVGLTNIVDTARRLGIKSKIAPLPSLSLGAFELTPIEILEAYSALARLGQHRSLSLIDRIEDLAGERLYEFQDKVQPVTAADATAEVVGILKLVLDSGTGRGARAAGFAPPAAGKTGTTNDKKDAWFVGFTPNHAALVWVGYDDNTSHQLTGGSGAVPIWTQYMKAYASTFPPTDFQWPESVEVSTLSPQQQIKRGVPDKGEAPPPPAELVFKRGRAPSTFFEEVSF